MYRIKRPELVVTWQGNTAKGNDMVPLTSGLAEVLNSHVKKPLMRRGKLSA
jgi:hypothetical protein